MLGAVVRRAVCSVVEQIDELSGRIEAARKNVFDAIHKYECSGDGCHTEEARVELKNACDEYFALLAQRFAFENEMAHSRAEAEELASRKAHAKEMYKLIGEDVRHLLQDMRDHALKEEILVETSVKADKLSRDWTGFVEEATLDQMASSSSVRVDSTAIAMFVSASSSSPSGASTLLFVAQHQHHEERESTMNARDFHDMLDQLFR